MTNNQKDDKMDKFLLDLGIKPECIEKNRLKHDPNYMNQNNKSKTNDKSDDKTFDDKTSDDKAGDDKTSSRAMTTHLVHGQLFEVDIYKDKTKNSIHLNYHPVHLYYDFERYMSNPLKYISEQEQHHFAYQNELEHLVQECESELEKRLNRESNIELTYNNCPDIVKIESIIGNILFTPVMWLFKGTTLKKALIQGIENHKNLKKGYDTGKKYIDEGKEIFNDIYEDAKKRFSNDITILDDLEKIKKYNEQISSTYLRLSRTMANIIGSRERMYETYFGKQK
jgi:hypothetical protein